MKVAVTGHRPPGLGGYGDAARKRLEAHAWEMVGLIHDPEFFVCGMALGWDQAVACVCEMMSIPFIAVLPYQADEMARWWDKDTQDRFYSTLDQASEIETVGSIDPRIVHPEKRKTIALGLIMERNRRIVERCLTNGFGYPATCLAMWDGRKIGGTFYTIQYAKKFGIDVMNAYDYWGT